ncbi:MAG TPA: alpha/beta hydrolase [Candidatus Limnocylindrales bacterium]|nr:alpha/beta hydrolase [Candidatus Limnocylindrales bacterium]
MTELEFSVSGAHDDPIYVCRWGPSEGRAALVLVHGFGEHCRRYGDLVEILAAHGLAVYGYDLRGHGRSPGRRGHVGRWAEHRADLAQVVGAVRAAEQGGPVFLMGNSLGGLIALEYALHHPDGLAGVVASAPALAPAGVGNRFLKMLARLLTRVWPSFSVTVPMVREDVESDLLDDPDPLLHGRLTARAATEAMAAIDWTVAHAAGLRLPLLLIHGGADRLVDPRGSRAFHAAASSDDKELLEYPTNFHMLRREERRRTFSDVAAWIEARLSNSTAASGLQGEAQAATPHGARTPG